MEEQGKTREQIKLIGRDGAKAPPVSPIIS